ncbi:MAG: hypothetical protein JSS86_15955, partial [Cyanobacteria bacterium SZAS LIN-2]|nr:hypothetical protein [Cyanobacteria bacterium SZAS LIN-2]
MIWLKHVQANLFDCSVFSFQGAQVMRGHHYKLTLYVTPDTSGKALSNLYKALSELAYTAYQLEMIDVVKEPERASEMGVVDTPLLVYHAADGDKVV